MWGKSSPSVYLALKACGRKSWCLSSWNNSLGCIHWWGGGEYILSLHISTCLRSQSPWARQPSFHSVWNCSSAFPRHFQDTKWESFTHYILHLILFLSSLNPLSQQSLLEATFIFPFERALLSCLASKWVHFETPMESLSSILIFKQCYWIQIMFIGLTKWSFLLKKCSLKQRKMGWGGLPSPTSKYFCPKITLKTKQPEIF